MKRTLAELKAIKGGEESTRGSRKDMASGSSIWTLLRDLIDSLGIITGSGNITTVNAATYTVLSTDTVLLVDRAGVVAITIPASIDGRVVTIKDAGGNASQYSITITGVGTIDGEATAVIGVDYNSVTLISDSTNWFIL